MRSARTASSRSASLPTNPGSYFTDAVRYWMHLNQTPSWSRRLTSGRRCVGSADGPVGGHERAAHAVVRARSAQSTASSSGSSRPRSAPPPRRSSPQADGSARLQREEAVGARAERLAEPERSRPLHRLAQRLHAELILALTPPRRARCTVSTGHGALRSVRSATLPRKMWASPVRPCVPITIRSAPSCRATRGSPPRCSGSRRHASRTCPDRVAAAPRARRAPTRALCAQLPRSIGAGRGHGAAARTRRRASAAGPRAAEVDLRAEPARQIRTPTASAARACSEKSHGTHERSEPVSPTRSPLRRGAIHGQPVVERLRG